MLNKIFFMSKFFGRFKKEEVPVVEEQVPVWEDRIFWVETLQKIALPVLMNLKKDSLRKNMILESNSPEGEKFAYLEAFARVFNGIAPWLELGPDVSEEGRLREKYIDLTIDAISTAVNPKKNDYILFTEPKQSLVDMALFAQGLLRSKNQILNLLLSGNLAVRSSIFPLAIDSSTNEYYVPYSFDNPTMVEVIINGEFFSDLYLLNYLHEDSSIASVSGFNMSVADIGKVETITFRFHYSVDPQTTEWLVPEDIPVEFDSFAVGVDCEIITSPVFTAEYEPDRVMTTIGKFFDNLAIPYEISQVFDVFVGIWEVIPAAIRFTLIMCFSVACFFAVAKMLF